MNSFLSIEELKELRLKKIGKNVLISKNACFYNASNIVIGNNTRIDDFCILSGNVKIGSNVHVSAGVYLFGGKTGIVIKDFVAISSRCAVYAESDDYSGKYLTNPTVPLKYRNVECGSVLIKKHTIIGSGCTILPSITIGEGASIGSMSLVNKNVQPWTINFGIPCKKIKDRSKSLLKREEKYKKGKDKNENY